MKNLIILFCLIACSSCRMPDSFGFYQPITMSLAVPDGPAEYKAGWHAGCQTALGQKAFSNAWVYQGKNGPNMGNGVYAHDPVFQRGWGQGWFACALHIGQFVDFHATKYMPLQ